MIVSIGESQTKLISTMIITTFYLLAILREDIMTSAADKLYIGIIEKISFFFLSFKLTSVALNLDFGSIMNNSGVSGGMNHAISYY